MIETFFANIIYSHERAGNKYLSCRSLSVNPTQLVEWIYTIAVRNDKPFYIINTMEVATFFVYL